MDTKCQEGTWILLPSWPIGLELYVKQDLIESNIRNLSHLLISKMSISTFCGYGLLSSCVLKQIIKKKKSTTESNGTFPSTTYIWIMKEFLFFPWSFGHNGWESHYYLKRTSGFHSWDFKIINSYGWQINEIFYTL